MADFILKTDSSLFLWLNSIHSPFFDVLMYYVSGRLIWAPLYLTIIGYFIYRYKRKSLWIILLLVMVMVFTDQLSVHAFKNVFQRLRPCHEPFLSTQVHLINGHCGGKYGFISSHAANSFALAAAVYFFLRKKAVFIGFFFWASIVSYSRIYLGVHYPGDVLAGALFGILSAAVFYRIFMALNYLLPGKSENRK